jgi:hypothetical protein
MYVRKTIDVYNVEGDYGYGHGFEVVTAEASYGEARARLREYRENEPGIAFRIKKTRERIAIKHGEDLAALLGE